MESMDYVSMSLEKYDNLNKKLVSIEERNGELFDLVCNVEELINKEVKEWLKRKPEDLKTVRYTSVCLCDLAEAINVDLSAMRDRIIREMNNSGYQE